MEGSAASEHLANLNHADGSIRKKATLALGGCDRTHSDWAADLIAGITDGSPGVRFWAATALGRVAPDPDQAVPPLIELLTDQDKLANRQVAAGALATIGQPAAGAAVPALARVLATDDSHFVRADAVRALQTLAVWNTGAISVLVSALDDPDEGVRHVATQGLFLLGVRAGDAVPALRRRAENGEETEALRAEASRAAERILSGAPAYRSDEPYRSFSEAMEKGRFADAGVVGEVGVRLQEEDFHGALDLLEAGLEDEQDDQHVWLQMFVGARELDLPLAARYYERYQEASGTGRFSLQIENVLYSTCTVSDGMQRLIRYCSSAHPNPGCKLFDELDIDEDLARLEAWLSTAFTEEPPPDHVPGLWFGLTDVDRRGEPTLDMHVSGGYPDDEGPLDRVIGGSWEPRDEFAHSRVLDQLHRIAHAEEAQGPDLTLAYGALVVRWLAMTLDPQLLLGGAPQRLVAVGFDDGDSIGVGTLRPDGLAFPDR